MTDDAALPYKLYTEAPPSGPVEDAEDYLGRVRWESAHLPESVSIRLSSPTDIPSFATPSSLTLPHTLPTSDDFKDVIIQQFTSIHNPSSCNANSPQLSWDTIDDHFPIEIQISTNNVYDLLESVDLTAGKRRFLWVYFLLSKLDSLVNADQQYVLTQLFRKCCAFESGNEAVQALIIMLILKYFFKII
ncbi:hypothetical protein P9112_014244 [Eukaryota sp. TZLM1-RC]